MKILNTHIHELIFNIDKDAPSEYMKRWIDLKIKCENGENKHIIEQLKGYCNLNTNRVLPYLNRYEGGLGGNDNLVNKQIRFKGFQRDDNNDIILHEIISTDNEKWTYDELDDLIRAFIKMANFNIQAECVNGRIVMFNKNMLDDNYLENDNEF